ncbi:glycosyltransferase [Methylocaldum szegediense]|uniref:N-acetylglucosaminyl-diphospho-decaprenol L-rhamnosyltransferase n=1 Tax=Methylocaldum szegediense TaxID=73780 RepID=A0ABM9HXK7_9GAMM|nr:glycosyltransferase [Methylocaldum szegediense]CAI8751976.1 N-acetylglucosaminyl-diphospho-decaprenol L-rhamnosyltransferase [Methylocaldum szegediense]
MKQTSVVIVNFNAGKFLSECVRSVLASTEPVEVIVVDNRSSDNSIDQLRRDFPTEQRLRLIENQENLGFAKANNIALPFAQGDYILFLNPDCLIGPDTLAKMRAVMEKHPQAGMAGCLIRNADGSEQAGCRRNVPTPWRTFVRLSHLDKLSKYHPKLDSFIQTDAPLPAGPVEIEAISGAFMLVRRSAMEKVGPLDEGYFMHCEDLDWCMRFRQAGFPILFVPDVEILHVGGVCSASRPALVEYYKHKGMVRFYRKFFRHQYPAGLMWLVMAGIVLRYLTKSLGVMILSKKKADGIDPTQASSTHEPPVETKTTNKPCPSSTKSAYPHSTESAEHVVPTRRVIVTGATSLIGDFLLPALVRAGFEVHAISRKPPTLRPHRHTVWHKLDVGTGGLAETYGADVLIHLAPLWTLPPLLNSLAEGNIKRILAFSSTSLFTKENSGSERERQMVANLKKAEENLQSFCTERNIDWTIFRPTMVYSLGRDRNVTTIARFIKRFRFFPLVGTGNGLRQPVHAEDLALACLNAVDNPRTFNKSYNLSGGEVLTYREMVNRISAHLGTRCKIIHIPLPLMRFALGWLSNLPGYRKVTPEAANRINFDMCFDHSDATTDISFRPRRFIS